MFLLHYPSGHDRFAIAPRRERSRERLNKTMSTATDNNDNNNEQPNKRARFSETNDMISSTSTSDKTQPPKILADSFIRASVSSLHHIIAPDVEKLAKEHILLLSKRHHFDKVNQRMTNDTDHIPASARFKFELTCSDRAKELPEYKVLQEETTEIITTCQNDLRSKIIATSKLEVKALTLEIQRHLVKSLRLISQAYLLIENDKSPVDEITYAIAKDYIDNISTHTPMTVDTFIKLYKDVHTIDTYPISRRNNATTSTTTATTPTNNPAVSPFFTGERRSTTTGSTRRSTTTTPRLTQQQDTVVIPNPNIIKIKNVFQNIFVSSWTQYMEQQTKNELSIELKKLTSSFFTTRSTSDATAIVNAEPAADKHELKELIRLQTVAETKKLLQQLNDMKKELNILKSSSKNSNKRGKESASGKKTNTPTTSTNKQSPKKKKQKNKQPLPSKKSGSNKKGKAGGNNNATASGAKNSRKKNANNKSKKSGSSSNNKKSQPNNKSSKK